MQRIVTAWCWTAWVLIVLLGFPIVCVVFALTALVARLKRHAAEAESAMASRPE